MARKRTTASVSTFVMEHGLDHALIDELKSTSIEDPKLAKAWQDAHLKLVGILTYLGIRKEYNLE